MCTSDDIPIKYDCSPSLSKVEHSEVDEIERVGRGGYSVVILVRHKYNGHFYALKEMRLNETRRSCEFAYNEKNILEYITEMDPFNLIGIAKLRGSIRDRASLSLLLDFCSGAPLHHHIKKECGLSLQRAAYYVAEGFEGIKCNTLRGSTSACRLWICN
eukprot:GHVR01030924.1.p1 GENE.GHVR01030924.1~~GHVR01030924.1.p1  ORF type:complete len:159 (+),score=26.51 GHVR01030924.1:2-478(+)